MRITPNRLRSDADRDSASPEANRHRTPLDSTEKANRQTDKGITVTNLLHLVRTRVTNLGSGATTLTRLTVTEKFTTQRLKSGTCLGLRREKVNRTIKGGSRNLVTGLCVKRTHRVSTLGQHHESNLLRRDANLAGGLNRSGESESHCFLSLRSNSDGVASAGGHRQPFRHGHYTGRSLIRQASRPCRSSYAVSPVTPTPIDSGWQD